MYGVYNGPCTFNLLSVQTLVHTALPKNVHKQHSVRDVFVCCCCYNFRSTRKRFVDQFNRVCFTFIFYFFNFKQFFTRKRTIEMT